jgi:hypothetical protein
MNNMEIKIIDRGNDELLIVNEKQIRLDKLKGKQVIELLNSLGLMNVKIISFSEYEESEKQKSDLI